MAFLSPPRDRAWRRHPDPRSPAGGWRWSEVALRPEAHDDMPSRNETVFAVLFICQVGSAVASSRRQRRPKRGTSGSYVGLCAESARAAVAEQQPRRCWAAVRRHHPACRRRSCRTDGNRRVRFAGANPSSSPPKRSRRSRAAPRPCRGISVRRCRSGMPSPFGRRSPPIGAGPRSGTSLGRRSCPRRSHAHRDSVALVLARHRQVLVAVAVQVSDRDPFGRHAGREGRRRTLKPPAPLPSSTDTAVGTADRHREVRLLSPLRSRSQWIEGWRHARNPP